eukprot:11557568-Alexandrium_andersonii.AAC.1
MAPPVQHREPAGAALRHHLVRVEHDVGGLAANPLVRRRVRVAAIVHVAERGVRHEDDGALGPRDGM